MRATASEVLGEIESALDVKSGAAIANAVMAGLHIDDEFNAVRLGIHLREKGMISEADSVFRAILEIYPNYTFALHDYSISLMLQGRHLEAVSYSSQAYSSSPSSLSITANHARLLAANGNAEDALDILAQFRISSAGEAAIVRETIQFTRYLSRFPSARLRLVTYEMERGSLYRNASEASALILDAVRSKTPFSFLRLSDGEGGWLFMDNEDEASYSDFYRSNRKSFLEDWFGSDDLISSNDFFSFSQKLDNIIQSCELVGVPDNRRLQDEYRLVSPRGISTCVNVLRKVGVVGRINNATPLAPGAHLCSAHLHVELLNSNFYHNLFRTGAPIGVITSHRKLPDIVRRAGACVTHEYFTPGDSRNFWFDEGAEKPLLQWPDLTSKIIGDIEKLDLHGTVFLIASGFVGKHYLAAVKSSGGIALDIGAVANRWAVEGIQLREH